MAGLADREAAEGVSETYQYLVGNTAFYFVIDDGSIELRDGRVENPAVTLSTHEEMWAELASGKTGFSSAIEAGAVGVAGEPAAVKRLGKIFSRRRMLGQAKTVGQARASTVAKSAERDSGSPLGT